MKFKLHHAKPNKDATVSLFFEATKVPFCPLKSIRIPISTHPISYTLAYTPVEDLPEELRIEIDANIITVPFDEPMVRIKNGKKVICESITVFAPFVMDYDGVYDEGQTRQIYYLGTPRQLAFQKAKHLGFVPLSEVR